MHPARKLRLALLAMSHPFAAIILRALRRRPHHLVAIAESFRTEIPTTPTDLSSFAYRRRIPYLPLDRPQLKPFLQQHAPDLLIVAGSHLLLTPDEFFLPPLGSINIHPSLLPLYRGPDPLFWQYRNFDLAGGITLHAIDAGIDTGDIIAPLPMPIPLGQPYASTLLRAAALAADLLVDTLSDITAGLATRRPQRHLPCPQYARRPSPDDLLPDYAHWSLEHTWHFLHGLNPVYHLLPNHKISRLRRRPTDPAVPPGTLLTDSRGPYLIHPEGQIRLTPSR